MTAIGVYVNQIRVKQELLSLRLGTSMPGMPVDLRIVLTVSNVAWAAVAKLLVDKGVFTDAELVAALNAAGAAAWASENPPALVTPPDV